MAPLGRKGEEVEGIRLRQFSMTVQKCMPGSLEKLTSLLCSEYIFLQEVKRHKLQWIVLPSNVAKLIRRYRFLSSEAFTLRASVCLEALCYEQHTSVAGICGDEEVAEGQAFAARFVPHVFSTVAKI